MKKQDKAGAGEKTSTPDLARRAFLTGSTATIAASGIAAATLGAANRDGPRGDKADPRRLTYRETDHIRKFYQLSRF